MKVLEVTDLSGCSKRLNIELEEDDLQKQEEEVLAELKENAALPGFRRGRVPVSLLKKRFRKSIDEGSRDNAKKDALKKAFDDLGLKAVGEPDIKEVETEDKEAPPQFTVDVEYIPNFELSEYRGIKIEEPDLEITETQVAGALEHLRSQNALMKSIDDRPAQESDVVTIKVTGTIDGEPFPEGTHDNYSFVLGEKRHLPGFEEAVVGKSLDEAISIDIAIPDTYQVERLRGKTAHFEMQLNEIRERVLPELDDEFAKDLGMEDITQLKNALRERLEHNLDNRREQARRGMLVRKLVESVKFDAPPTLIKARHNYINAMQEQEFQRMGTSIESLGERKDEILRDNLERADFETRASLILEKIAEVEKIEVTDDEFLTAMSQMATESGRDPRMFAQNMVRHGLDRMLRQELRERKVMDFLLSGAQVEKVAVEHGHDHEGHDHDHEGHDHDHEGHDHDHEGHDHAHGEEAEK